MQLTLPELSLILLIGASGSGKSTFAQKNFLPTEVLSSDYCRSLVSDDENSQNVNDDAFDVLQYIAAKRLKLGRLTVIDATNVQEEARRTFVNLAREYHCLPVAIVFDMPEKLCLQRNQERTDRQIPEHAVRRHVSQLKRSLRNLKREGFRYVHVLKSQEDVDSAEIVRQLLWNNLKHEHGPFDIIGDVHGCIDELRTLLNDLGYRIDGNRVTPPEGRKAIFLGDLVDRGPGVTEVLKLVMGMVQSGQALCVPGNHDIKLLKKLNGANVQIKHGLDKTLEQLEAEPPEFIDEVKAFIDGLVSHYVLDDSRLVVAHAGMKEALQGRGSGKIRDFALYGETSGETDEYGLPVRYDWAADYRGRALVVYGHTPQSEAQLFNNTLNIDTGCVFGGKLTAYRYPEREFVEVKALKTYYEPAKPFLPVEDKPEPAEEEGNRDVLDISDVTGKRVVGTRLYGPVTIKEENSIAALELMSRFAVDPHWLIYLPPTMSPCETSGEAGCLEHPAEAFAYYRTRGVGRVVCQQKHMGSRAVVVACRTEETAARRFGVADGKAGVCYTRTGRRFFEDDLLEDQLIGIIRQAAEKSGFWEAFNTDWVCLDCELMPWSAKAQALLVEQYAPVGAAGSIALPEAVRLLKKAAERTIEYKEVSAITSGQNADLSGLIEKYSNREECVRQYIDAYRNYCWPVSSLEDYRLAPFHLLATENAVYSAKDHIWHMDMIAQYFAADTGIIMKTNHKVINVTDSGSVAEGVGWWEELTGSGGEGMVVKPFDFTVKNNRELLQPAVKCRGKEYLRIIYGPEYTLEGNLERLKKRSLSRKRSLALREFSLGIEAMERFVRKEPLYRVHECVFGVLAMESEPVDPRL